MKKIIADQITIRINHKMICQNFTWQINAGECWGILGPNGCGKTTFLHTLLKLHPLHSGHIYFDDENIRILSAKQIAKRVALLFQQHDMLLPQTVWDYCMTSRYPHQSYFSKLTAKEIDDIKNILEQLELTAHTKRFISELSGGEKRRLAIAAVMIQSPYFYLLDEPTNHLDVRQQMQILKIFRTYTQTKQQGVIATLHDVNIAEQFCDHVLLFFPDGEILKGPISEILTEENLSRLYQYPIKKFVNNKQTMWQPCFSKLTLSN